MVFQEKVSDIGVQTFIYLDTHQLPEECPAFYFFSPICPRRLRKQQINPRNISPDQQEPQKCLESGCICPRLSEANSKCFLTPEVWRFSPYPPTWNPIPVHGQQGIPTGNNKSSFLTIQAMHKMIRNKKGIHPSKIRLGRKGSLLPQVSSELFLGLQIICYHSIMNVF